MINDTWAQIVRIYKRHAGVLHSAVVNRKEVRKFNRLSPNLRYKLVGDYSKLVHSRKGLTRSGQLYDEYPVIAERVAVIYDWYTATHMHGYREVYEALIHNAPCLHCISLPSLRLDLLCITDYIKSYCDICAGANYGRRMKVLVPLDPIVNNMVIHCFDSYNTSYAFKELTEEVARRYDIDNDTAIGILYRVLKCGGFAFTRPIITSFTIGANTFNNHKRTAVPISVDKRDVFVQATKCTIELLAELCSIKITKSK